MGFSQFGQKGTGRLRIPLAEGVRGFGGRFVQGGKREVAGYALERVGFLVGGLGIVACQRLDEVFVVGVFGVLAGELPEQRLVATEALFRVGVVYNLACLLRIESARHVRLPIFPVEPYILQHVRKAYAPLSHSPCVRASGNGLCGAYAA